MGTETFGEALRAAMARRSYTLEDLRRRLTARGHPVSLAALSYWRSGQRTPQRQSSLDAIPELEAILGLEAGALLGRLPSALERRSREVVPFTDLVGARPSEPLPDETFLHQVAAQIVVDVGIHREIVSATARQVMIATRDGVAGLTLYYQGGLATDDLVVRAIGGCRIGEKGEHDDDIRSLELVFDRPLARDEQVITEFEITHRSLDLDTRYSLAAGSVLEEALLWVRFHPECRPQRCWIGFDEHLNGHEWPVDLAGATSLLERQARFGPGRIDARWEW